MSLFTRFFTSGRTLLTTLALVALFTSVMPASFAFAAGCSDLVFTSAPSTVAVGQVTAFTIEARDTNNTCGLSSSGQAVVQLSDGAANGTFYSNSNGTNVITSITLSNSNQTSDNFSHQATFYYKDTTTGPRTITADAPFDSSDPTANVSVAFNPDISVKLNGGSPWTLPSPSTNGASVSVTPNASISAAITVTKTGGDWHNTCYAFDGGAFQLTASNVPATDHDNSGTWTETITFSAPTAAGNHTLAIGLSQSNNSCNIASGSSITMTNAVAVATPKANTLTVITSDTPDPSLVGQAYTVGVSVGRLSGSNTPTGTVTVTDGAATSPACTLSGTGATTTATCTLTSTTAGAKNLVATYSGDTNFNGSTSVGVAHTVNAPVPFENIGLVSFTFDDGYKSQFNNVSKLGSYKGTFYINSDTMKGATEDQLNGTTFYADYMPTGSVVNLFNNGYEIGAHTRTHLCNGPDDDHCNGLQGATLEELLYEVDGNRLDLLSLGIDTTVSNLAYPFGASDEAAVAKLKSAGFIGGRSVNPGLNQKSTDRYSLFARQINDTTTLAEVQGWIDQAIANKQWLILVVHEVEADCGTEEYCTTPDMLEDVVAYTSSHEAELDVVTMSQGLDLMDNKPVTMPGAPVITQAPIVVAATSTAGASVTFPTSVTDDDLNLPAPLNAFCTNPNVSVEVDPGSGVFYPQIVLSGQMFPIGTTTVNCSAADTGGNVGTTTFTVTVTKVTDTVTFEPAAKTYGDADFDLAATSASGLPVTFSLVSGGEFATLTGSTVHILGAGDVTISASTAGDAMYNATTTTKTFTINKAAVTVTADAGQTKVFGQADPAVFTYQVTGSLVGTDAFTGALAREAGEAVGAYPITQGTLALNANYDLTFVPADFTITVASGSITLGATEHVYDGTPKAVTVETTPTGLSYEVTYDGSTTAPTNAGVYAVVATITQPGYAGSANGTLTITKAPLTVSATAENKPYDGTAGATAALTVSGALNGDELVATGDASFADKNVGTGKTVTVSNIVVTGTNVANYSYDASVTTTADITAIPVTVTATGVNKVYDATTNASVTFTTDALIGDDVGATGTASFDTKNVGEGKAVSVTGIALTGADAGNYSLTSTEAAATADVTALPTTVSAVADDKQYDETDAATVTLTVDAKVEGDVVNATFSAAAFADANVGTDKTVTVTGIALEGGDAANYSLTNTEATALADITAEAGEITLNGLEQQYDGTPKTVTVESAFEHTEATYEGVDGTVYGPSADAPTDAGHYKVTAEITDANHAAMVEGTLVVAQAPVTVTADNKIKLFGAAEEPTLTYATTSGELFGTDAFTGELARDAGEAIGEYAITQGTLALSANYALTFVPGTLTITTDPDNVKPTLTVSGTFDTTVGSSTEVLVTAADEEETPLVWTISTASSGTVSPTTVETGTTEATFTYTPGDIGLQEFDVSVSDGNGTTTETVSILVRPLPECPAGTAVKEESGLCEQVDTTPVDATPGLACENGSDPVEVEGEMKCAVETTTPVPATFCDTANGFALVDGQCVKDNPENEGEQITGDGPYCDEALTTLPENGNCGETTETTYENPVEGLACENGYVGPNEENKCVPAPISSSSPCPANWHYENGQCETGAMYTITTNVTGSGSISPSGNVKVLGGTSKEFTFSPSSGNRVKNVTVDAESKGNVGSFTFENVTADHAISVEFEVIPTTSSGGSRSSGGSGGSGGSSTPVATTTAATTTASTTPQVLGVSTKACYVFSKTLATGSTGPDVTELQNILIAKGYLKVEAPTGYYGSMTAAAVSAFQKDNGLDQVGVVGPKTRALLNDCGGAPTSSDMTEEQKQALIQTLKAQLDALLKKIAELVAAQQTSASAQ